MTESSRPDGVELSPIVGHDPLDLRVTLISMTHWYDSSVVRAHVMADVDFPVDDMGMFLIVNQLTYRGALRPTDLASALGMSRTNVTKIVHRLEQADLAVRVPSPVDERSVLVALTASGREIGHRIADAAAERFEATLASWTAEEVETFKRLVYRFSREAVHELALRSPTPSSPGQATTKL